MNEKIVISTIYSYEPVISGAIKLGATRLILLKDSVSLQEQDEAIRKVNEALVSYVKIETISTAVYDLFKVAADTVELIDSFSPKSEIFLNISAGRKTKSLGLMFAGYARSQRIKRIVYITKENQEVITLPNLPFNISEKQKKVLFLFNGAKPEKMKDVYKSANISRATLFLMLKEFKKKGYMEEDGTISVAGRIALL